MTKKIIPEVASPLLILLFAYAAMNKLLEYDKFVGQIAASPALAGMSKWLAWLVPGVELIICLLLILPKWRLIGFYAGTILMAVFTVYVAALLTISAEVPCSCGGILNQMSWPTHLVFNIVYTGIAVAGLIVEKRGQANIDNQLNYQA